MDSERQVATCLLAESVQVKIRTKTEKDTHGSGMEIETKRV